MGADAKSVKVVVVALGLTVAAMAGLLWRQHRAFDDMDDKVRAAHAAVKATLADEVLPGYPDGYGAPTMAEQLEEADRLTVERLRRDMPK